MQHIDCMKDMTHSRFFSQKYGHPAYRNRQTRLRPGQLQRTRNTAPQTRRGKEFFSDFLRKDFARLKFLLPLHSL